MYDADLGVDGTRRTIHGMTRTLEVRTPVQSRSDTQKSWPLVVEADPVGVSFFFY